MLFQEKNHQSEPTNESVINLTDQVTDNELEQLLSNDAESSPSCSDGVCVLNWRPARRNQAA